MKQISFLLAVSAVALVGCQRDDSAMQGELTEIKSDLAEIKGMLAKGGAAGAGRPTPERPQRPQPEPNAVYSMPIDGDPYRGEKTAKVTVVEAFEFA